MKKIAILSLSFMLLFGLVSGVSASDQHQHEGIATSSNSVTRISVEEVQQRMQQRLQVQFVDTRTDYGWNGSKVKIPGAVRVRNNSQLSAFVQETPRESFIVAYCT